MNVSAVAGAVEPRSTTVRLASPATSPSLERVLEAALGYVDRCGAWPLFPADAKTKRPIIKTGRDHAEHASIDLETVRRWFAVEFTGAAIGMPTGAASGTVVIDADLKHNGEALLAELEADLGPLPRTKMVRTQSGGLHVYCAHPGDTRVKTGAGGDSALGRLLGGRPGVDVRGDGGIVILPPSCGYQWIDDDDDDEPLPPLPVMWLAAIQGAGDEPPRWQPTARPHSMSEGDRVKRATAYLQRMPIAIEGSGGHTALYKAALALVVGFDLDDATALHLLATVYNPLCSPPWDGRELERQFTHKVTSAARSKRIAERGRGYLLARAS